MKAITTRYVGPTNHRGSRIVASDSDGNRITVPYDHGANIENNHLAAAIALAVKMGWVGLWAGGSTKNGMCWVDYSAGPTFAR